MTPKGLLTKLEEEMHKASPDNKLFYTAIYEGAARMYECFLEKQRKYYETHREHNREYQRVYQRAYHRARKEKAKEVEESK